MNAREASRGFTLIELLITLAVAVILATVAVPAYNNFIANQRVKTGSQALFASLTFARSEAIKRNRDITITRAGSDWSAGWIIKDGATDLRKQDELAAIAVTAGGSSITFNRTGRTTAGTSVSFSFCDSEGSSGVTRRSVTVDTTGRPSIAHGEDCSS
jgi:type IV fimbrial biogenesis protein FimT